MAALLRCSVCRLSPSNPARLSSNFAAQMCALLGDVLGKPTLYGISGSRALRSIWAMEEVGVDYAHVATNFAEQSKDPSYLAVNPNGRIPALVDGDVVLFESMAINLYAAEKYGTGLYPDSVEDRARTHQ